MARHKKIRDKYFINLNGQKIEVTREVYEAWYGGERKERYLEGLDESSIRWRRDSAIKKLKKYFEKI